MEGFKFLTGKYDLSNKNNVIDIINYYNSNNKFYESFSYLNNLGYYYENINDIYYDTLVKYLSEDRKESADKNTPIIITWTISPKNVPFLHMTDPQVRLRENLLGLCAWILDKSFENILIVESSEFKLNTNKLFDIGKEFGKQIEFISFLGSDNVSKFGKGYGEGEILEYAFNNSMTLKSNKFDKFVKMNGKQYVPFYEYLFMNNRGSFEYFNLHYIANKLAIDTRFYCINTSYYKEKLFYAYKQVNDHENNYLEHVFYETVKDRINYYVLREPIVLGKQGSVDKNYGNYPEIVHNLCNRLLNEIV